MHSLSELGANVPAFLAKLWKLVDDPETSDLISWTEEGTSFFIRDQAQFARKLLPMYYKHNNMASFIRQLNMYGFHKIVSADAGSLRLDKDEMEFAHQYFLRGHPYLLEHIKRKVGKSQIFSGKLEEGKDGSAGVVVKAEFMNKLLSEVKGMRGRQESVESRLSSMKQENEALWRELSLLRQKHSKQQTIVNKLIQFLVTLVQPSHRLNKRRYPLMIHNVDSGGKPNGKVTNTSDVSVARSPSGPTIHELDADTVLPDAKSILPDSNSSNTITLHVPGMELEEVIDANGLVSDVLDSDTEVLESFDPSIIPSSLVSSPVPSMAVNPEEETAAISERDLNMASPSPESLISMPPSEFAPAVVVPGLQNKTKLTSLVNSQTPKVTTRSASAAALGTGNRKTASVTKGALTQTKGFSPQNAKPQPVVKKELKVLPPRNRKRKHASKDSSFSSETDILNQVLQPVDLLAEMGLTDPKSPDPSSLMSTAQQIDSANDSMGGPVTSPAHSQLVAIPESPIPDVNSPVASPVASPASHCSVLSSATSPLSGPTITDVTSPLALQPPSNLTSEQLSSYPSPGGSFPSHNDLALACTSQGSSSPANSAAYKASSLNREDFDLHLGSMESELGQIKDFIHSSGIQLDANTLLGLFSGEDQFLPDGDANMKDLAGNELMYYQPENYQPDFGDLYDMWTSDNNRSTPPSSPGDSMPAELNTPIMTPTSPGFSAPAHKRRRN